MGGYFFKAVSLAGVQLSKSELKSLLQQTADKNTNLLYDDDEQAYYHCDEDESDYEDDRIYYKKPERVLQKYRNPDWGLNFYCLQDEVYERAEHDIAPDFDNCKYIVGLELKEKSETQESDFPALVKQLKTIGDTVKEVYALKGDAKIFSGIKTYY